MTTDSERREVAERMRSVAREVDRGGFSETIKHVKLAVFEDLDRYRPNGTLDRLADLIDPTCEARRDTLLYPATGLTPEHEETVYRCDECGEIISYDEGYDPETDLPAYCERCGSRITRIGEPWDE